MSHPPRIMYIEYKGDDVVGPARIGRVTFSKTGKSVYYQGKKFGGLRGSGFKRITVTWRRESNTGSLDARRMEQTLCIQQLFTLMTT